MKKDPLVFVKHIMDSIEEIENFTKGITGKEKLLQKKVVYEAVIRKIEIIGEAVKNIPLSFKDRYSAVPWKGIAGMRDKLIHNYFEVDLARVWVTVTEEIPSLKKQIQEILDREMKNRQ